MFRDAGEGVTFPFPQEPLFKRPNTVCPCYEVSPPRGPVHYIGG